MKYLVDSAAMRRADENTSKEFLVSSEVLMERASLSFVSVLKERVKPNDKILVICSNGNNGGDGICIARLLKLEGYKVCVLLLKAPNPGTLCELQYKIASRYKVDIKEYVKDMKIADLNANVYVDALFGTGLKRDMEGDFKTVTEEINSLDGLKFSVDIPSGICADNGKLMGTAFKADLTVTFGFYKIGHFLYPGKDYAGEVVLKDIGITEDSFLGSFPNCFLPENSDLAKLLPKRFETSNKGSYGKVLAIAGSEKIYGAAFLCAKASYISGAGLVKIFTHEANRIPLERELPEAMLETYSGKDDIDEKLSESLKWADVILIGPGISTDGTAHKLLELTLKLSGGKPIVMDADALNVLSKDLSPLKEYNGDIILTPHMKEMSRLFNKTVGELKENRIENALKFSDEYGVTLVMKDADTITVSNGKTYINSYGNNGMSTGGSGDVLAGLIAGLKAQGATTENAAIAGVMIHALSGDHSSSERGVRSMLAGDLLSAIIKVLFDTDKA